MRNPIRTLSGVAPISVMVPPRKCPHGTCTYCPSLNSPQSYTPQSPAVIRAKSVNYNPKKQITTRLKQLKEMSHPTDKVELIIMGGTFLAFPEKFQSEFIKGCYDALNNKTSKNLEEAKKLNEKAKQRCVALCVETRPDICGEKEIKNLLKFGCTRVELGVQAIDDKIYEKVNRGHKVKDVIEATKRLKENGFKVGYHIMWGLPGSNITKDIKMFKELFSNENFRPDQLKVYPCQVIQGAKIEELFHQKKYKPYTKEQVKKMLLEVFPLIPEYCRVMRVMRKDPRAFLVEGISDLGLRNETEEELRKNKTKINEIRFREIGFALRSGEKVSQKIKITKTEYSASDGKEIFLQAINKERILFGLLRLRFNKEAVVRELHVYGPAAFLGEKDKEKFQHKGLGKELLKEAESLVRKNGFKELKIISGVGVREYYRNFGYKINKERYMVMLCPISNECPKSQ